MSKRIGIYCGSFNPVHKGHVRIAQACLKQDLADEVLIIATGEYWEKKDLMPLRDRIAMLKMTATEGIVIDEEYNDLPYTYQIFDRLEQDHPEDEFSLILGADNLPRFSEWRNYQKLLEHDFIILPRDGIGTRQIRKIMKDLNKENYHILKMRPIDISSTYIREHLNDYEAIRYMIDKRVYDYLIHKEEGHAA